MVRFVHTADIHFGMENYGKIDPKTGIHTRLLDFKKALDACIDKAIEHNVDFFLFCGDAYKTAHPSPTQQQLLFKCFMRLFKANIPVVIIIGNHDNPFSFGKSHALDIYDELPLEGFHVIAKPAVLNLQVRSGTVQIVGIPWPTRNSISLSQKHIKKSSHELTEYISHGVTEIIKNFAQTLDPTLPAILAGHLTVSNGIFSGSEKRAIYGTDPIFLPSDLAIKPFDYVALGHLHRFQNLNQSGTIPIIYPGSIERIDFGERKESKGFCLVEIREKNAATYEFVKVPIRPFIQFELTLDPNTDQTKQIIHQIESKDITNAIIKIIYHVPIGIKDTVDLQKVQAACHAAMFCSGIIPVHTHDARAVRTPLNISMDLKTLLTAYFENNMTYKDRTEILINKTLALKQQLLDSV